MGHVDTEKRRRLVKGLVEKTVQRKLSWEKGASDREFVVDFPNSSISLKKDYEEQLFGNTELVTKIFVINSSGDIVDEVDIGDVIDKEFELRRHMQDIPFGDPNDSGETFFRLVDSQVSRIDDVYDEVLNQLAG